MHPQNRFIMMKITPGMFVALNYKLYLDHPNGELIEQTSKETPFTFIFKEDEMLPEFENRIEGLAQGEKFSFGLKWSEAYGEYDEERVVEFSKEVFLIDGEIDEEAIATGAVVPMRDEDGNELDGFVIENKKNTVIIDFNHPLAGENIYFEGEVLKIELANHLKN